MDLWLGRHSRDAPTALAREDVRAKRFNVLLKMVSSFSAPNFDWAPHNGSFSTVVLAHLRSLFASVDKATGGAAYRTAFSTELQPEPHGCPISTESGRRCLLEASDTPANPWSFNQELCPQVTKMFETASNSYHCPCGLKHRTLYKGADVLIIQSLAKAQLSQARGPRTPAVIFSPSGNIFIDAGQQQDVEHTMMLAGRWYTLRACIALVGLRAGLQLQPGPDSHRPATDMFHAVCIVRRDNGFHVVDSDLNVAYYRAVGVDMMIRASHIFFYSTEDSSLPASLADVKGEDVWERIKEANKRGNRHKKEAEYFKGRKYVAEVGQKLKCMHTQHIPGQTHTHMHSHSQTQMLTLTYTQACPRTYSRIPGFLNPCWVDVGRLLVESACPPG